MVHSIPAQKLKVSSLLRSSEMVPEVRVLGRKLNNHKFASQYGSFLYQH